MTNKISQGIGLLKKWLAKQGIGDYTELSNQEKATYNQWEAILTKELTLDDLKNFLSKQSITLTKELREAVEKGEERRALKIAARLENYEAIVTFIDEPNRSREILVSQLKTLIETN